MYVWVAEWQGGGGPQVCGGNRADFGEETCITIVTVVVMNIFVHTIKQQPINRASI